MKEKLTTPGKSKQSENKENQIAAKQGLKDREKAIKDNKIIKK